MGSSSLAIPCNGRIIRIYPLKKRNKYRCCIVLSPKKRLWGHAMHSIGETVASLLSKLPISAKVSNAVWAAVEKIQAEKYKPLKQKSLASTIVYFKKHPFEGIVQQEERCRRSGKTNVRMALKRNGSFWLRTHWCRDKGQAFAYIQRRCIVEDRDVPAMRHTRPDAAGVHKIHQFYGLYRDGKGMSPLFSLSSEAWQAYARRHQCEYKLWKADEVDTLLQLEAPDWLITLYKDVRYHVQRVHIARFFHFVQVRRPVCRPRRLPKPRKVSAGLSGALQNVSDANETEVLRTRMGD